MNNKEYRPTLAQLRTFVTIAENRHFGSAAAKLNISQPSLSQALVALESGLEIQLIERSTRKVIVTPSGEELLPYAKATLEAADAFVHRARGAQGMLTGSLAIGIIPTIAPYILPELLRIIHERFPALNPKIVEETTPTLLDQLRDEAPRRRSYRVPLQRGRIERNPFVHRELRGSGQRRPPVGGQARPRAQRARRP